jgi:hypothetical protein
MLLCLLVHCEVLKRLMLTSDGIWLSLNFEIFKVYFNEKCIFSKVITVLNT